MDPRVGAFGLLILLSGLCLLQFVSGNSVIFLDGSANKYVRSPSEIGDEIRSISLLEVVATASVLLGVAPPVSLTSESSTKLDKILRPNPFVKPRAVVLLEVQGMKESSFDHDDTWSTKIISSGQAQIEISGDDEVSQISLDESIEYDSAGNDRDFENLARWMRGSYVGSMESHDGILEFLLPSGASLKLYISKKEDRAFALGLVSLVNGVKMAVEMQEDFEASNQRPVDLLTGYFTGMKALETTEIANQGLELFQVVLTKLFSSLQKAYKGEVVGIILAKDDEEVDVVGPMVGIKRFQPSFGYGRRLEEISPVNTTIEEVILVRTTLAWVTGVILLISALIGIYYLLYMPFTRDTLLYSNVKLD